jgi:Winged helix DNA-binding domain
VRRLGGVQAQVQASAELQLAARVDGLTRADVQRALWEDRTLAKAWTIRGTLHVHASDELAMWLALRRVDPEPLPEWRGPRGELLPALGLDEVLAGRAAVWEALDGRVLTREELADAVGPPAADRVRGGFGWFLDGLCQGPPQGARITLARPDQWVARWKPVSRARAVRLAAERYVHAFAPVRRGDVQDWLGLPPPGDLDLTGDSAFPAPSASVRLLPEYDAYVMGFRERDILVPQRVRELVKAHGRGRYEGPAGVRFVIANGVAVGLWERTKRGRKIEIAVTPTRRMKRADLGHEAERIGAFLGLEPTLVVR